MRGGVKIEIEKRREEIEFENYSSDRHLFLVGYSSENKQTICMFRIVNFSYCNSSHYHVLELVGLKQLYLQI